MDLPQPPLAPDLSRVTESEPPYLLRAPAVQSAPVVFASAHSGRDYTADFIAAVRLDPQRLRRSEDSFVDELFGAAPALGAPLIAATFPRAYCDANREPWELDPAMFADSLPAWVNTASPRVGAGLGTVPRVVGTGEAIYAGKLRFADAESRVALTWQPFHEALRRLIDTTVERFGVCLLIDCHSMPGNAAPGRPRVDFVLGDAHGTACAARLTRGVEQAIIAAGHSVRRNDPYAGGYITRHYGRPRDGVHALQIELCRTLYMDETRIARLAGFAAMQGRITRLIGAIIGEACELRSRN